MGKERLVQNWPDYRALSIRHPDRSNHPPHLKTALPNAEKGQRLSLTRLKAKLQA
jgi:hypothetical protein